MKDTKKERAPRPSISRMVLGMINEGKLRTKEGKEEGLKVVAAVKKQFNKSRFNLSQFFWYLSRSRRQHDLGLPTDRLVAIPKEKVAPKKKAKAKKPMVKPAAQTEAGK